MNEIKKRGISTGWRFVIAFTLGAVLAGGTIFYLTGRAMEQLDRELGESLSVNRQLRDTNSRLEGTNSELVGLLDQREKTIDRAKGIIGKIEVGLSDTKATLRSVIENLKVLKAIFGH